jgi:hypothetical protein
VLVPLEHSSGEPTLEEVSDAVVAPVEARRVEAVEALHPGRELRLRRPDDEMEVVRHQRPRVELPAVPRCDLAEQPHPGVAIQRVENDRAALDAARRHVIVRRRRKL